MRNTYLNAIPRVDFADTEAGAGATFGLGVTPLAKAALALA